MHMLPVSTPVSVFDSGVDAWMTAIPGFVFSSVMSGFFDLFVFLLHVWTVRSLRTCGEGKGEGLWGCMQQGGQMFWMDVSEKGG